MSPDYTSLFHTVLYKSLFDSFKLLFSTIIIKYWYFWLLLLLIRISPYIYTLIRFKKAGLPQIDLMNGSDFELYLEQLFNKLGYNVERVGKVGDFGADLVIEQDGIRTVVQAKQRKSGYIGIEAVQQIFASKNHYNAAVAMVITNVHYSTAAKQLARENQIKLIGRKELANLILKQETRVNKFPRFRQLP